MASSVEPFSGRKKNHRTARTTSPTNTLKRKLIDKCRNTRHFLVSIFFLSKRAARELKITHQIMSSICDAAWRRQWDVVKQLVEAGEGDINHKDQVGHANEVKFLSHIFFVVWNDRFTLRCSVGSS